MVAGVPAKFGWLTVPVRVACVPVNVGVLIVPVAVKVCECAASGEPVNDADTEPEGVKLTVPLVGGLAGQEIVWVCGVPAPLVTAEPVNVGVQLVGPVTAALLPEPRLAVVAV